MGLLLAIAGGAVPAHANTVTNPSLADCQGVERSVRNSSGGDRAHGAFGPLQAYWVKYVHQAMGQPYGQWLNTQNDANCPS
jgi:hypothetical protein